MDESKVKAQIRERLEQLKKNDPERRERLSKTVEERMRGAADKMTREIIEHGRAQGLDISESQARKKTQDLANSIHREDQEKGKR